MKYIINTLLVLALLVPTLTQAQDLKVKDVKVNVEEENGYKKITIRKTMEDGTIDVINWEGKGEIPEEIAKEFGPGGGIIILKEGETGDSTKVITKSVTVIVDEEGEKKETSEEKHVEVIIKKDGEHILHEGKDAEVIILKDGKEVDGKEVKVWIQKEEGEGAEKIMKVRVHTDGEKDLIQSGEGEEIIIIKQAGGEPEKVIINKAEGPTAAPKIERSLKLKDFQVSPNPASERINLQFKAKKAPVTIRVFDAAGREVYKEFQREFDGNYQNQIELENISSDFFFVSVEQKGKVYTEKVIQKQ
ncbi:MAG TPA: T9SS type A sorting domain-containing protein [Saprospiraceae bacterium]|nr:T9SS type A sorting domain-containing protein [Saprospiraceae bacterium]